MTQKGFDSMSLYVEKHNLLTKIISQNLYRKEGYLKLILKYFKEDNFIT